MEKAILIQARTTSKRFPGKILKTLNGQSILAHIVDVCSLAQLPIFLCIPKADNVLFDYYQKNLVDRCYIFVGSEEDVLDRFYQCAKQYEIKTIIRICADTPFLQLQDIREQMILYKLRSFSYGNNVWIFSFKELEKTWNNAQQKEHREDLCNFMMKTVDYPEDLERWRKLA